MSQGLETQHCFQEYTFKKIASCDVCKDFLRGKSESDGATEMADSSQTRMGIKIQPKPSSN